MVTSIRRNSALLTAALLCAALARPQQTTTNPSNNGYPLVTTLGSPGSDSNAVSEKAIRTAISSAVSSAMLWPAAPGITVCTGTPCTAWGASLSLVTSLGVPGLDTDVPSEKSIRTTVNGLSQTIASGTASLGTSAIASGTCDTVVTVAATGVISRVVYTDIVIGSNTTQLTSAAHPFTSSQTGSYLRVTSGTGFTTGYYRIVSVSGSTATMDRSVGTASSTGGNGVLKGDNIIADFDLDPTGVTGYQASSNGMLTIIKYPTADNVNFKVCNNTLSSITPGAVILNWQVIR